MIYLFLLLLRQFVKYDGMTKILQKRSILLSVSVQIVTKIIIQKNAPVAVGVTLLFFFMHSSITETVRWSTRCPLWHSPLSFMLSPFSSLKELFQSRRLQSAPPVAKKSPFLEKTAELMGPLWPNMLQASVPFTRSQICIDIDFTLISLLAETETMCVPSGCTSKELTESWCASQCCTISSERRSNMLMVLLLVLAKTHWSVGWKLVQVIAPSKQSYLCTSFFFSISQISNFLSSPPEQTRLISAFTLALLIQLLCPSSEPLNFCVSLSHSLMLLSSLADKMVLPSLKKQTDLTAAVCPLMTLVLTLVPGYHNRMVLSQDELARTFWLGEKAMLAIFLVCPSRVRLRLGLLMFQRLMQSSAPDEAMYLLRVGRKVQVMAEGNGEDLFLGGEGLQEPGLFLHPRTFKYCNEVYYQEVVHCEKRRITRSGQALCTCRSASAGLTSCSLLSA